MSISVICPAVPPLTDSSLDSYSEVCGFGPFRAELCHGHQGAPPSPVLPEGMRGSPGKGLLGVEVNKVGQTSAPPLAGAQGEGHSGDMPRPQGWRGLFSELVLMSPTARNLRGHDL